MKIQTKQKYVLLAGMTGFVLGICSANLWMKEYILDIGIFNQFFLEQYNRLEIVYEEYFWYLIKNRGVFLLILTAAAGTRYRKSAVILTVIWLGFCVGMVICTAIARLGIKGIVLCVIAVMPQVQPVSQVQQIPPAPSVQQIQPVVSQIQPDSYSYRLP